MATGAGFHGIEVRAEGVEEPRAVQEVASTVMNTLRGVVEKYQEMVVKDPDLTSKLEMGFRLASYLLPGRFGGSWQLSELSYCVSNLYALLNDYIVIKKCPASSSVSKSSKEQQRLLWLLSLLDTIEVAMELLAEMKLGEPGKYAIVFLMQITKAILRLVLVFKLKNGLLTSPAVSTPDRKRAQALHSQGGSEVEEGEHLAWKAPRTGKVIRSIHSDSTVPYSQLQHHVAPPSPTSGQLITGTSPVVTRPSPLRNKQLIAELLYIARPLVHLLSMFSFSQTSWKPWLLSLFLDLLSLQLHGGLSQRSTFKDSEKSEIRRRRVVLLLYLLRSPFYDKYTKDNLFEGLKSVSATVPLVHLIIDPILTYLPVWQTVYSYSWMG